MGKLLMDQSISQITSGKADDVGGRSILVHLERVETLELYSDNCSAGINYITFSVSLSQFDVE